MLLIACFLYMYLCCAMIVVLPVRKMYFIASILNWKVLIGVANCSSVSKFEMVWAIKVKR